MVTKLDKEFYIHCCVFRHWGEGNGWYVVTADNGGVDNIIHGWLGNSGIGRSGAKGRSMFQKKDKDVKVVLEDGGYKVLDDDEPDE